MQHPPSMWLLKQQSSCSPIQSETPRPDAVNAPALHNFVLVVSAHVVVVVAGRTGSTRTAILGLVVVVAAAAAHVVADEYSCVASWLKIQSPQCLSILGPSRGK